MKRADKVGAAIALILGEDELANQQVAVKHLRQQADQELVSWNELAERLTAILAE